MKLLGVYLAISMAAYLGLSAFSACGLWKLPPGRRAYGGMLLSLCLLQAWFVRQGDLKTSPQVLDQSLAIVVNLTLAEWWLARSKGAKPGPEENSP